MLVQGIEEGHSIQTVASLIIAAPISAYFGLYKGHSVNGWMVGRAVLDILHLLLLLYAFKNKNKLGSFNLQNLKNWHKGAGHFIRDSLVFSATIYSESLGWELSTLAVAQTRDIHQIGAYASLVNFSHIIWYVGNGFTCTSRPRINFLLGQEKAKEAKRVFLVFTVGNMVSSSILGLCVFFGSQILANIYVSDSGPLQDYLMKLLQVYAFVLSGDFFYAYVFTVSRSLHQTCLNMILNLIILISLHSAISFYLVKSRGATCVASLLVMQLSLILIHLIMTCRFLCMDWSHVEKVNTKVQQNLLENIPINNKSQTQHDTENSKNIQLKHDSAKTTVQNK
jgi:Na+-driven multidrug efflux pump